MAGFFEKFYREKVVEGLRQGKDAVLGLAELPQRCKDLEQQVEVLKKRISEKEQNLDENKKRLEKLSSALESAVDDKHALKTALDSCRAKYEKSRERTLLEVTRLRLLVVLQKILNVRTRQADAETIKRLSNELKETVMQSQLLKSLHERAVARLEETRSTLLEREKALQSTLVAAKADFEKASTASRELENVERELSELEAKYKNLMGTVKKTTRRIVEKLIDKGMTSQTITDIVPSINGIYSQNKLLELEESIRKHNAEQEALLGLKKLRQAKPPSEDNRDDHPVFTVETETNSFFERIFCEP